jgi:hypothetical protein
MYVPSNQYVGHNIAHVCKRQNNIQLSELSQNSINALKCINQNLLHFGSQIKAKVQFGKYAFLIFTKQITVNSMLLWSWKLSLTVKTTETCTWYSAKWMACDNQKSTRA